MKYTDEVTVGNRNKKQGGFGALEVMIALMIGALVIIGAVFWYAKLTNSANNSDELQNLSSITSNTRQLKTSSGYGAAATNLIPALITAGGIPDGMQQNAGAVFNVWGGAVTVVSTGTGYTIGYAGMPSANCVFLATKGASSTTITTSINGGAGITGEVTAIAANTGCSNAINSVTWSGR